MKLTLLRHGLTEGNRSQLCYGRTDLPLLPEGIEALKTAVQTMHYPTAQYYYTSGMRRTEQTFALLYGDIPHGILPGLREGDFGRFEMIPFAELQGDPEYQRWITDDTGTVVCPSGESFVQVYERAMADLLPLLQRGEDAVCVMHGAAMAALMTRWFPGEESFFRFIPNPGEGWQITFDGVTPLDRIRVPQKKESV